MGPEGAQRLLVIAAHADDEVLGCGGTILRRTRAGHEVGVVILTRPDETNPAVAWRYQPRLDDPAQENPTTRRRREAQEAGRVLGVEKYWFGEAVEVSLDQRPLPPLVSDLIAVITEWQPDTVYVPHWADLNQDHRRACEAALIACRPPGPVNRVLAYAVDPFRWPPDDSGRGQLYVQIQGVLAGKLKALECYASELRDWPHYRSFAYVEQAAKLAGAWMGLGAVEVFSMVWEVER